MVLGLINGLIDFFSNLWVCAKLILGTKTVGGEHSEILFTNLQIANWSHDKQQFFISLVYRIK